MKRFSVLLWLLLPVLLQGTATARQFVALPGESSVQFQVKATAHSFTGTANLWSLDAAFSDETDLPEAAAFVTRITDLSTGNEKRDKEMRHWFEAETFPEISFRLAGIDSTSGQPMASGNLTIHGVEKPVTVPLTIQQSADQITVSGELVIDHRDYGLEKIRKFAFLTVAPEVTVSFTFSGQLQ